jgi:hypothetical protein
LRLANWLKSPPLGRKIVSRMEVNTYEENRKFGYASDRLFPMQFLFTLVPVPEGTELRMLASGEPANVFGKVAMPILTRSVERQLESDLYALKAILEDEFTTMPARSVILNRNRPLVRRMKPVWRKSACLALLADRATPWFYQASLLFSTPRTRPIRLGLCPCPY